MMIRIYVYPHAFCPQMSTSTCPDSASNVNYRQLLTLDAPLACLTSYILINLSHIYASISQNVYVLDLILVFTVHQQQDITVVE